MACPVRTKTYLISKYRTPLYSVPKHEHSHLYIGCNVSYEVFPADATAGLSCLRLQLHQLCPHLLSGMCKVPNLSIGVKPKDLWRIHKRQVLDKLQVLVPSAVWRNEIVHFIILVEVKRLEGVKYEISHVLVHVGLEHTSIKVIDGSSSIHNLNVMAEENFKEL